MDEKPIEDSFIPEDADTVKRIATEIIEPALQKALGDARNEGTPQEIISALSNCYGGLLVDSLGRKAATDYLRAYATHIASVEEQPLSA